MESMDGENGAASGASSTSDEYDVIVPTPPATPPTPSSSVPPPGTTSPIREGGSVSLESSPARHLMFDKTPHSLPEVANGSPSPLMSTSLDSNDGYVMIPFRSTDGYSSPAGDLQNRRSALIRSGLTPPTLSTESTLDSTTEVQQAIEDVGLSSRRASDPISPQDWEAQRERFIKHYIHERRTLRDVKYIMESRYNFKATERMYKRRILEWNLRKYTPRRQHRNSSGSSSKSDSGQRPSDDQRSSPPPPPRAVGDEVEEVPFQQSALSKRNCALRRDLDAYLQSTNSSLTYDRFKALSKDLQNVEIILTQVYNYYDSYTESAWTRTFPKTARASIKELPLCSDMQLVSKTAATPMVRHPGELFNRIHMAIELLSMKTSSASQLAWRMLGDAFGMVKDVLLQQHPQLLRYFFMQFWDCTLDEYPEIRRSLFMITYELAVIYLGPNHPITLIAKLLPKMDQTSHVCEVSWRRQLNTFETILGEGSDESLRLKMALTGNYVVAGQYDQADSILRQIVAIFEPDSTAYYHRAARCRIAWIQSLRHNYIEAERGFVKVLRLCHVQSGLPANQILVDDIYLASMTHLARIRSRTEYQQGETLLTEALELCQSSFGVDHAYTYTIANELKTLQEKVASISS